MRLIEQRVEVCLPLLASCGKTEEPKVEPSAAESAAKEAANAVKDAAKASKEAAAKTGAAISEAGKEVVEKAGDSASEALDKTKEAAAKNIVAFFILSVHPPREIQEKFLEYFFKKKQIRFSLYFFVYFKDSETRPSMNGWIDITQIPFVSRKLSVRMHIPFFR